MDTESRKVLIDNLSRISDCRLKVIELKMRFATQLVKLQEIEDTLESSYRDLSSLARRHDPTGAEPG